MNPEFRRQLWLQFSFSRLIVPPLLLLVVVMGIYGMSVDAVSAYASIAFTGGALFVFSTMVIGANAAGASVMDEMNEHTWDQQRMNAMTPWSMTWGKWVGSTSFAWYCGAWCLAVALPTAWITHTETPVLRFALIAVMLGVLLQLVVLTVQLQMLQSKSKIARRSSLPLVLAAMLWIVVPVVAGSIQGGNQEWWGYSLARVNFFVFSLALFATCALIATWRSMADALLVRQWPWGWPILALLISTYASGFAPEYRATAWCIMALGISVLMSYIPLLTESQSYPHWQRIVARAKLGQWKIAIQSLPRWVSTLLLGLPLVVLVMGVFPNAPIEIVNADLEHWLRIKPVVIWLTLLRDCALALLIGFSATQARRAMSFPVTMVVLHGLLPWVLGLAGGSPQWSGIIEPLFADAAYGILIALVQVAVVLGLLWQQWMKKHEKKIA